MIDFKKQRFGTWHYVRNVAYDATFTTEEQFGTGSPMTPISDLGPHDIIGQIVITSITTSGTYSGIFFWMSKAMTYGDIINQSFCNFDGDLTGTNAFAPGYGDISAAASRISNSIDSVTKDETSPRNVTNYANLVPWFNYTNATLYEALKTRYTGFNTFGWKSIGGGVSTLCSNPYRTPVPGLNSNYNYDYGSASDFACVNAPGVSTTFDTTKFGPSGGYYDGNPEELTGTWANGDALGAYLMLSDPPPSATITLDYYVEGQQSPNITMKWSHVADSELEDRVSNATINIYAFMPTGESIDNYTHIDPITGRRVIYPDILQHGYYQAWSVPVTPGSHIDTMYLALTSASLRGLTDAELIISDGINKIPENIWWFFQAEYVSGVDRKDYTNMFSLIEPREWTSLYPDHTLHDYEDAASQPEVVLNVVLHTGHPEDDEEDDDDSSGGGGHSADDEDEDGNYDDDLPDFTDYDPTGFPGDCVLTKIYSMPKRILANVGAKLWSQSYFDVLKIQSNPIENIVAVKWFPFNIHGTVDDIKVGDVSFGIRTDIVPRIKKIEVGSYKYTGLNGRFNFLDNTPFTIAKLHLPYCGIYQIDASALFNATISVVYYVDLTTGECLADVRIDGTPYLNCKGQMGVDIPLTGTDRVQQEMKALSAGIHTGASVAGHALAGDVLGAAAGAATGALSIAGADYTSQRCANPSGVAGSYQNHAIYIVFEHADSYKSKGYGSIKGYPCHLYKRLINFQKKDGSPTFIQIDTRTCIDIPMTSYESAELERLLTTGVYI